MNPSPYVMPGIRIEDLTPEQVASIRQENPDINLDSIKNCVCEYYDIKPVQLEGKRGKENISWARHVYCYISFHLGKQSLYKIGVSIGGRDHTTVMNSKNVVKDEISVDSIRARDVREISGMIVNRNSRQNES